MSETDRSAEARELAHKALHLMGRSADGTGEPLSPKEAIEFVITAALEKAHAEGRAEEHDKIAEREAAVCPEDVGFDECIRALRAELAEQARLNGMGSEREARLMAEVERLRQGIQILGADGPCQGECDYGWGLEQKCNPICRACRARALLAKDGV